VLVPSSITGFRLAAIVGEQQVEARLDESGLACDTALWDRATAVVAMGDTVTLSRFPLAVADASLTGEPVVVLLTLLRASTSVTSVVVDIR